MRSRGITLLLLATVAGLLAVLLAARWLKAQGTTQTARLWVATQPVSTGIVLTPEMLRPVEWPAGMEPPGAFTDAAKLSGRVTSSPLVAGEPVLEARLAPPGTKGGLSALVGTGKRAMTVRVNDVVGVAGFALPGTYVDVLVNTQADGSTAGEQRSISKIVLERMLVLAVAQDVDSDPSKPKVVNAVTLEVTPQQAEVLDLARSVGSLSLVLRNQTEADTAGTQGATKEQLLALAPRQVVPVPVVTAPATRPATAAPVARAASPTPARTCVDVFRGTSKVTECF
jgi:pilus assembly protein CpaB